MKRLFILFGLLLVIQITFSQNVGVGTTTPHASAALDIQSTSKGMLVPRIALTAANVASPVTSPADALLVYNTAIAGAGSNAVSPGFYYWNTAASRWTAISSALVNDGSVGFGSWGDCSMNNISGYNPVGAPDGNPDDELGYTVAISGNYAIAGAPANDNTTITNSGAAYIYNFNGTNWVQQQKLTASDASVNALFGYSVAISDNYAIVAAYNDLSGRGSAYIFFYNGSAWVQQQKLLAADGLGGDGFGRSVSISGNYAIVGAATDDVGSNSNQGSAYVYFFNGSTWIQQQKLLASDGAASDEFGFSVSISGTRILVGVSEHQLGGYVYYYFFNGGTWSQLQKINAPATATSGFFGTSVSISGNYAVIGAYYEEAAYLFYLTGATWIQHQRVTAFDGVAGDHFGISTAISGNYTLIGAFGNNNNKGAAYLFRNITELWEPIQKIVNPNGTPGYLFGHADAIDNNRFMIGAFGAGEGRGKVVFGKIN